MDKLLDKVTENEILSIDDWIEIAERAPSARLFQLADAIRCSKHPGRCVTYVVDRNINYTNICASGCAFCAFYRRSIEEGGYLLSHEQICRKVEDTLKLGGSGILLQGGLNPAIPLSYFEDLLCSLKRKYQIYLHCFSPPEIHFYARLYHLSIREFLIRLREAGLDSIPGGGAEILDDTLRGRLSNKGSTAEWLEVMRTAHLLNLPTTATMVLGLGEDTRQRFLHLERIKNLQDETGGFLSFIPWTFQPRHTVLGQHVAEAIQGEPYLRWMALSRIFLRNIPHVQVSRLTQGMETARLGLHCGADDIGSIMIEENVVAAAGAGHQADEQALREAVFQEGFIPFRRNAGYVRLEN